MHNKWGETRFVYLWENRHALDPFVIRIRECSIRKGQDTILEDIDLSVQEGEFLYLIGRTGSGKSSLIKAMYGEWVFQGGEAFVAGFNMLKITRKQIPQLRRKLGIVFQEFFLLRERNVFDNLDFVLRATGWKSAKERRDRIARVLTDTRMASFGHRFPAELSGGEQQRLAIARALLNDPKVLLADEPAGNLDPQTSDEIVQLIRQLSEAHGTAVLFATHDYRLINKFPGGILRCQDGKIDRADTAAIFGG